MAHENTGIEVQKQHKGGHTGGRMMRPWSEWTGISSPFSLMRRLFEDMDWMSGQALGSSMTPGTESMLRGAWMPAIDLCESGPNLVLRAELPGCEKGDIDLRIEDGILTLEGERRQDHEESASGHYHAERRYGRFMRSISLPSDIDEQKIEANFRNGVLEVVMPRTGAGRGRSINIGDKSGGTAKTKH